MTDSQPGVALPRHSVAVAGVAVDDAGRVLVVRRRDNGLWQAPGGVLELDETFHDGVVREVLEETGVTVAVDELTGVYKNIVRHVVALVFRCHPVAGEPTPTDESAEACWLTPDDATDRMLPAFAVRVSDALIPGPPPARTHDGRNLT
jgi:ADP-ribose pyrophosphatase YjhB (NUDIX family)